MNKTKALVSTAAVLMFAACTTFVLQRSTLAETEPIVKTTQKIGSELPLELMFEKSSGIVVATLSDVHVKYAPSIADSSSEDIMTFATAKIEESIKTLEGNPKSIKVRTLGGEIGNVKRVAVGGAILRDGDRVLLFLADKVDGAYEIAGWRMGWYPLNERNEYRVVRNAEIGDDLRVVGLPDAANVEEIRQKYELYKQSK